MTIVTPLTSQTPVTDSINSSDYTFVDIELQDAVKRLRLLQVCALHGVFSVSGNTVAIKQLFMGVLSWAFLKQSSMRVFCLKHLQSFASRSMSTFYRFLNRDTINWRAISGSVAKQFYKNHDLVGSQELSFVVDDTIKQRRGRKIEGSSTHFDHTQGRCVNGQQVLQLGLVHENGFLPLDSQIFVGDKNRHELENDFSDGRSAVARDFRTALEMDKNEMLRTMIQRAMRSGFVAKFLSADSWFCNKTNVAFALAVGLVAVLRMKRSKTKYRINGRLHNLVELYAMLRRRMTKTKGIRWKTVRVVVEMDLGTDKKEPIWTPVAIVFSAPKNGKEGQWAAFLCTDLTMSATEVLEVYARRWAIEVYFKEVKQNMAWLVEQTGHYPVHYASIHLAAIRYILLSDAVLTGGFDSFAEARNELGDGMEALSFMKSLWLVFKSLLWETLDGLSLRLGRNVVDEIKQALGDKMEEILEKALQIDQQYLDAEEKALNLGVAG